MTQEEFMQRWKEKIDADLLEREEFHEWLLAQIRENDNVSIQDSTKDS